MITVTLHNYSGNKNTVNKQLDDGIDFNGEILEETNILYPVLTIRMGNSLQAYNFNYCEIPLFGRYYFIDSITFLSRVKARLKLSVDVLKSYENEILEASATVKQADEPDKYSSNREIIYNRKPNFGKIEFPNKKLFNDKGTMIMVTIKG